MSKTVTFEWDDACYWWTARFYDGAEKVDFKRLTETEEDNLAEYLTDKTSITTVSLEDLIAKRDEGNWQDEGGDSTNFELMLNDHEKGTL